MYNKAIELNPNYATTYNNKLIAIVMANTDNQSLRREEGSILFFIDLKRTKNLDVIKIYLVKLEQKGYLDFAN